MSPTEDQMDALRDQIARLTALIAARDQVDAARRRRLETEERLGLSCKDEIARLTAELAAAQAKLGAAARAAAEAAAGDAQTQEFLRVVGGAK